MINRAEAENAVMKILAGLGSKQVPPALYNMLKRELVRLSLNTYRLGVSDTIRDVPDPEIRDAMQREFEEKWK